MAAALTVIACAEHDGAADNRLSTPTKAAVRQAGRTFASQDAATRFAAFLERAVLTSPEPVPDSLSSCDWLTDSGIALAKYKVLATTPRGDTVDATAEVLTVAEEHDAPGRADLLLATLRTRIDTLHWKMTRNDSSGVLGVCGYSNEGYDFIRHGYDVPEGEGRRWTPPGASWARARELVDSIRRQAGLPVHPPLRE